MPTLTLYTKRFCPWCVRARAILDRAGLPYTEVPIDANPWEMREHLYEKTGGRSDVPQAFVDDAYIGDDDALQTKSASGELARLLKFSS